MLYNVIFSFILLSLENNCRGDLPEVKTPLGVVEGFWKTTINGRKHAAFEGIPYAKPPVGDLRFEEPQPISAWSGIWEAKEPRKCMQTDTSSVNIFGQEDCLFLNVYVPAEFLHEKNNLDVIVSIHGGGFMASSAHEAADSRIMMDKDIVLVSVNYRLGILGFLSTEDDIIPGNNGMKDQVMALKWVKDNIASFGGNPNSVTIVGLSAGGASVHLHYFSPLSKGLFTRGLSQSGTALAPWAIKKHALQQTRLLANLVGCPESPTRDLKTCLKQTPVENMLKQMKHFFVVASMLPIAPFAPVIEKGSTHAFLEREPFQMLQEGSVLDVPWITSMTAEDGLIPAGFLVSILDQIDQNWSQVSKFILNYNNSLPDSKVEIIPKQILDFYLGPGEHITRNNFNKFTKMCTDRLFGIPAEVGAKMQARVNKSPVYFYLFNYRDGEKSFAQFLAPSEKLEGVSHADDSFYFYGFLYDKPFSEQDANMTKACQDMLFSYASTGKPSFDGTDVWQATITDELVYLNVTGPRNFRLQSKERLSPNDFWSKLGLLENENLIMKDTL